MIEGFRIADCCGTGYAHTRERHATVVGRTHADLRGCVLMAQPGYFTPTDPDAARRLREWLRFSPTTPAAPAPR